MNKVAKMLGLSEEQVQSLTERLDGTIGEVRDDGIDIGFSGACPAQGYGTVDGRICYYRARHGGWSLEVWAPGVTWDVDAWGVQHLPAERPTFEHGGEDPDDGWTRAELSAQFIREAVAEWRKAGRP